ncbi:uncharacterized protein BJ212DRAFT_1476465 [Suillus subaureus]|uniref:Uncharacterized protein n=1 Tax=Suillus subaureus TaxID=48587 RepID=A0A9P7EKV5_9AGAM|nr:uncharacterized protein BJ212DRAFT_1476465 [Suillus subaureus]KAG1823600.1 hypothetical protein BJ212DRAFT_1476465 [Suillus subaureus]
MILDYLKLEEIVARAFLPFGSTDAPLLINKSIIEIAKKRGLKSTSRLRVDIDFDDWLSHPSNA